MNFNTLIKQFPCLWDRSDAQFGSRTIKKRTINELFQIINENSPRPILPTELHNLIKSYKRNIQRKNRAKMIASASQQPDPNLLDPGRLSSTFLCKMCLKTSTGYRYRCLECPDHEMCGECERRGGHHDDHYVLRVPMQRPTVEVDQVESAARRAFSSFQKRSKPSESTAEANVTIRQLSKITENETSNSKDSRDGTGNDSENTFDKPSDTEKNAEETLHESGTTQPEVAVYKVAPEVKEEWVIIEDLDALEKEVEASASLPNSFECQSTRGSLDVPPSSTLVPSFHLIPPSQSIPSSQISQAPQCVPTLRIDPPYQNILSSLLYTPSQGVPQSQSVPPSDGVPPSQSVPPFDGVPPSQSVPPSDGVPPSKRKRDDDHHFIATTYSHKKTPTTKEQTELCTETFSSSTAATSSKSGSKMEEKLSAAFFCKMCLRNPTGYRYRCLVCPDYDMCGDCERRGGHHDDHYVLRVPMQRPTMEVNHVESAARGALSLFPERSKPFESTAEAKIGIKQQTKIIENKPIKTKNSEDSRDSTGNDSQNTVDKPSGTEKKPDEALHESATSDTELAGYDDEPEVKEEWVIME